MTYITASFSENISKTSHAFSQNLQNRSYAVFAWIEPFN